MNLYNEILQELQVRNTAQWEKFPPFFIASAACHMFNIVNQSKKIYFESGFVQNTRLHISMIAPQGFSKSFWLKQFLDGPSSIFGGSSVNTDFELRMSEAGYIGTIKFGEHNQIIETPGLCQEECNSIVGIEEFSDLMKSMKEQTYNIGMENELLTTLDSGRALKRLSAGKLDYVTNLTLWTATQPARYDLSGGLARRFMFLFNIPTLKDCKMLQEKVWETDNIELDFGRVRKLHNDINDRFNEIFTSTRKIQFHEDVKKLIMKLNIVHYEHQIYKRLALGYTLMKDDSVAGDIEIKLDGTLKRLILTQYDYRIRIKQGTVASMVWMLIKDEKEIDETSMTKILLDFGMSLEEIKKSVNKMHGKHMISKAKDGIIIVNSDAKEEDLCRIEDDLKEFDVVEQKTIEDSFVDD